MLLNYVISVVVSCLLMGLPHVNAVFVDEINVTDWALQQIGEYKCVVSDRQLDSLIVISDLESIEGKAGQPRSLVSFVNKTNGDLILRKPVNANIVDVMLNQSANELIVKGNDDTFFKFDLTMGFEQKIDQSVQETFEFISVCQPSLSGTKIDGKGDNKILKIIDPSTKLVVLQQELPDSFQEIKYLETDNEEVLKFMVRTNESRYIFYEIVNDKIVNEWWRDESSVNVVDSTFIDVSDSTIEQLATEIHNEQNFESVLDAYIFRIKTNFNSFEKLLKRNKYSPGRVLTDILGLNSKNDPKKIEEITNLRNTKFGLKKILVILTQDGMLSGLDIVDSGRKIWSIDSRLPKNVSALKIEWFAETNELFAFAQDGSYVIFEVLDHNSSPVLKSQKNRIDTVVKNCVVTSINKLQDKQFFVKFNQGCDTKSQIISIDSHLKDINTSKEKVFITDHDNKSVFSYMFDNKSMELKNTWKINVDDENEEIVGFASRENVKSVNLGTVLGSRDVLYKYLYPNVASYIVFNKSSKKMYINIIDTITGEILFSQVHDQEYVDIDYPINIVVGENWVIYTYFSLEPIPEQKMNVIELYESLTPNIRKISPENKFNALSGGNVKPETVSKSYYFPEIINKMILTTTRFDITTKAIVLELENGQITYLPKFILSARRKMESEMNDNDKKEFMASPYVPSIPINDNFIVTHVRDLIFGKNSYLVSSSTNLESTTIICDIGHDIFCTRITPSGPFDVMSPAFEKGKLIGTVIVCLILCVVLRPFVNKKKVKDMWLIRS